MTASVIQFGWMLPEAEEILNEYVQEKKAELEAVII